MNQPRTAFLLKMAHADLRVDLCSMIMGVRQIVHQDGILGGEIAAGHTIAAQGTCFLLNTNVIDAVFKSNVDRRAVKLFLQKVRRLLECLQFRQSREVCG